MEKLLAIFLGGHEGFVSRWYLCPANVGTIGYGFTWNSKAFQKWWMAKHGRKMKRGDTISKADALEVLQLMIAEEYGPPVESKLGHCVAHVKAAAKSMVYNCGAGSLKWKWAQNLAAGNIKEACCLWKTTATTGGGKKLPGLVRRRKEEATIAEFNQWPAWMDGPVARDKVPDRHLDQDDIRQAQTWLKQLGYYKGELDGLVGNQTTSATIRFQKDHGTLKADGIIGRATMAALERAIDLKNKAAKTTAGGGATAGGGVAADQVGTPVEYWWLTDALVYAGVGIIVLGLIYLAWKYRDEVKTVFKKIWR